MNFFKGFGIFILLIIIFIALIMPESLDKHISQIITLLGALSGLVTVIWTQYNKSIEEKNKLKQFELEKKHQISKEKYQELFNKKIDVYQYLYLEVNKFNKQLHDLGRYIDIRDKYDDITMEEVKIEKICVKTLKNIFKIIEKNYFVISNELMELYKEVYKHYKNERKDFDTKNDFGVLDNEEEYEEYNKIVIAFYNKNKSLINNFFNLIESETKEIKLILETK